MGGHVVSGRIALRTGALRLDAYSAPMRRLLRMSIALGGHVGLGRIALRTGA